MPELVELHETLHAASVRDIPRRVGVVAVCLDREERDPAEFQAFLAEHEIRLPVLAVDGSWDALADRYGFLGPPCTVLLDRSGAILERFDGRLEAHEVLERLRARH